MHMLPCSPSESCLRRPSTRLCNGSRLSARDNELILELHSPGTTWRAVPIGLDLALCDRAKLVRSKLESRIHGADRHLLALVVGETSISG